MRVTIEELGLMVSERREPKPLRCLVRNEALSPGGEWVADWDYSVEARVWVPVNDYATEDAAAMRLFDELPTATIHGPVEGANERFTTVLWWQDGAHKSKTTKTRPVAICLAWWKWKTGEDLEVIE